MKTYEYLSERFDGGLDGLQSWLDERGQLGWLLITKTAEDSAEQRRGPTLYSIWFVFVRERPIMRASTT